MLFGPRIQMRTVRIVNPIVMTAQAIMTPFLTTMRKAISTNVVLVLASVSFGLKETMEERPLKFLKPPISMQASIPKPETLDCQKRLISLYETIISAKTPSIQWKFILIMEPICSCIILKTAPIPPKEIHLLETRLIRGLGFVAYPQEHFIPMKSRQFSR